MARARKSDAAGPEQAAEAAGLTASQETGTGTELAEAQPEELAGATVAVPQDVEDADDAQEADETEEPAEGEDEGLDESESQAEPEQGVEEAEPAGEAEEPAETEESQDPEGPEEPVETFLPAASLLFQAPDPARARRRRRVTAAAAAPRVAEVPAEPVTGVLTPASDASGDQSGQVEEPPAEETVTAQAPAKARRRRRKVTAAQGAPQHVSSQSQAEDGLAPAEVPGVSQVEGDVDGEATATSSDQHGETETAQPARSRRRGRRRAASRAAGAAQEAPAEEASALDAGSTEEAGEAAVAAQAEADRTQTEAERIQAGTQAGTETDGEEERGGRRRRRRGGRGRRSRSRSDSEAAQTASGDDQDEAAQPAAQDEAASAASPQEATTDGEVSSSRRRRRRRSRTRSDATATRDPRDEVTALKGSTRLEAKRQRRREGRAAGRRRPIVTEAEFLARRESVDRQMIIREQDGLNQIAVLEDGLLVEHYVARHTQTSMVGNVYVGRVQNVLPSMEAAFVDLGKGRNAVLYAGEVNWDAAGMEGKPRRIEDALSSGDPVLVQVTKDPIGHKGARLTSQVTLAGRYLVLVPGGTMTGISRKLPDTERRRLKSILKRIVPDDAGVIVRTAAEGASEEQLRDDVERLAAQWATIDKKAKQILSGSGKAPQLLKGEPELAVRVVRDVFNEDFRKLIVQGPDAWKSVSSYVEDLSPDLADRLEHWVSPEDVFSAHRIDEQLAKGFDRKVWLPSGGTLIIDRTEAMTVIDVNTGRFTGAGGTLEETVTRNNLEAAEEIVRQLRLRDIGGMIVIDFVDMVLESNRDLVLRRLVECLGRDRTRHQVTEVTSLGLVQMTRKRVGQGLVEAFSTPCECCGGRGFIVHANPVENQQPDMSVSASRSSKRRGKGSGDTGGSSSAGKSGRGRKGRDAEDAADDATRQAVRGALAQIAAAAEHAHREQEEAGAGAQDASSAEAAAAGTDAAPAAEETAQAQVADSGEGAQADESAQ